MALDVYFKEDILNALRAAQFGNAALGEFVVRSLSEGETAACLAAFQLGFQAALVTQALAFGLEVKVDAGRLVMQTPPSLPVSRPQLSVQDVLIQLVEHV